MKYRIIQRLNPRQPAAPRKWYAARVHNGKMTQDDIAEDIVVISSLARGDVANVIESLLDTVPKYLLMGKSVSLGALGTFRLSFSSKGVDTPEDFQTNMISRTRIIFKPSTKLRNQINQVKFEKA